MANQVYIIPRRNDLDGMNIQVTDLWPSESQKNNVYDGFGQAGYLKWSLDAPGATQVDGDSWAGGSTNTELLVGDVLVVDSTVDAANDCQRTAAAQFGLAAYLRERVEAAGLAAGTAPPTPVQAQAMADGILAAVEAGTAPTLANINAALSVVVAATELTNAGGSESFGAVEEVVRIIRGEVYRVRAFTIVTDAAGVFLDLAARQVLEAAQASVDTFYAAGLFLVAGEPAFRAFRPLYRNDYFNVSNGEGVLAGLKGSIDFNNPNFAYTAGTVTAFAPRAFTLDPAIPVPADGDAPAIVVADHLGNLI
jgi:hypothetical protein